ncbi:hypothetical protein [Nocardia veterana]|uniref:Uncharacterized protein n=1 Tax=Nocardia veterana TaxID=132249 RepID=A0A7X6LZ12_9NOCA|nr:hypothetical protein [Nocardia veterana]NKY87255.1 hypothetical protein [Nocardia veterana]
MRPVQRICEYCSHIGSGDESRCGHCGAPLRVLGELARDAGEIAAAASGVEPAGAGKLLTGLTAALGGAEKLVAGAEKLAGDVHSAEDATKQELKKVFPAWQWKAALGGIVVMILLAVLLLHSCSTNVPAIGELTPMDALPVLIRGAADCHPEPTGQGDTCVVAADDPLLSGAITGGRPLTLTMRTDAPDRIDDAIARWRSSGGVVVADGATFVEIGPAVTVWYADRNSGLHLETSSFANRAGAQTFLLRSGLVH